MRYLTICFLSFSLLFNFLVHVSHSDTHPAISRYNKYLEAIGSAQKLDDLNPYISKRKIEYYGFMTEEEKKSTLAYQKNKAEFTEIKGIEVQTQGDSAELTVDMIDTSSNYPATLVVYLVKEGGEWKVDKEKYKF